jgi:hypothetical protein
MAGGFAVAKTINPPRLVELGRFWIDQGGRNLGVVGDAKHAAKGVSYHLGRDQLLKDAYSIQTKRDKDGLSNAASAIDLGRLRKTLPNLRAFSRWLVARCMDDTSVRRDIREIIYTPDGKRVQRYSGIENKIFTGPGNGDDSHLTHTRDSEARDKVEVFRPFFEPVWGPDVGPELRAIEPDAMRVALAIRRAGHDFGFEINLGDLAVALTERGHQFGAAVDPTDMKALISE